MPDELEAVTTVHAPREEVYAFLRDVEGYAAYSRYIRDIARYGDGDAGTEYDVTFAWWKLSYTARLRITDLDPPDRIGWELTRDLDARGVWRLEPTEVDDPTVEHATRVTLTVRFDPDSADDDAIALPRFVPMAAVVEKARPIVEREAERVTERVVADLEGEPREATLTIRTRSDAG